MPKLADGILAQHHDNAVKLASRPNGVSRLDLMKELGVSRVIADKLIKETRLVPAGKAGRTEFFKTPFDTTPLPAASEGQPTASDQPALPEVAKAAAFVDDSAKPPIPVVHNVPPPKKPPLEETDSLDAQVIAVKRLIQAECDGIAKLNEHLLGHQALLTALFTKRVLA